MKRLLYLFLLVILAAIAGCTDGELENFVNFYYPRADLGYNSQESVFYSSAIGQEVRTDLLNQAPDQTVNLYLKGPNNDSLNNPFPKRTELLELSIDQNTLVLVISDHLAELTGVDLIIACTCLARTGMELTGTDTVQIRCANAMLEGKKAITFDHNTVIFDDPAAAVADAAE